MNKKIWGWFFFDWASQPYNTLLLTFIFGPYITEVLGDGTKAQATWGDGVAAAGLLIAVSAPFLGAIADRSGGRMGFIWLFHAGDPLLLKRSDTDEGPASAITLGPDLARDHVPQALVAAHAWQSAVSLPTEALGPDRAGWSLVSCTVTPGFVFDGFHLADADFDIPFSPATGPQQHPEDETGG